MLKVAIMARRHGLHTGKVEEAVKIYADGSMS